MQTNKKLIAATKIVPLVAISLTGLTSLAMAASFKATASEQDSNFKNRGLSPSTLEMSEDASINVACLVTCGRSCGHTDNC